MSFSIKSEQILHEGELLVVEQHILHAAANVAVLGDADLARELVQMYFTEEGGRSAYYATQMNGLNYLFMETGQWPGNIPEDKKQVESAEYRYSHHFEKEYESFENFASKEGFEKFMNLPNEEDPNPNVYSDYKKGDSYKSMHSVLALDLSLLIHEEQNRHVPWIGRRSKRASVDDLDDTSKGLIKDIASRMQSKKQIEYLTEAPRLWPLLLQGLLADAAGMSPDEVRSQGEILVKALRKRLDEGRVPALDLKTKTLTELLTMGENNTLNGPGVTYLEESGNENADALFKDPASSAQIAELEQRLSITLPADYKEFLSVSNGFGFGDIDDGIFNGYFPDPALHPVDEPSWCNEPYFELPVELLNISREIERLAGNEKKVSGTGELNWDTPLPLFTRIIEIGTRDIDNLWLVHPDTVKEAREAYYRMLDKADERQERLIDRAIREFCGSRDAFDKVEWACAKWSSGGSASLTVYPSFRAYLEAVVEDGSRDRMEGYER